MGCVGGLVQSGHDDAIENALLILCLDYKGENLPGLLDSGASHNFVNKALAIKLGWKVTTSCEMNVRLADQTLVKSTETCHAWVNCGSLSIM